MRPAPHDMPYRGDTLEEFETPSMAIVLWTQRTCLEVQKCMLGSDHLAPRKGRHTCWSQSAALNIQEKGRMYGGDPQIFCLKEPTRVGSDSESHKKDYYIFTIMQALLQAIAWYNRRIVSCVHMDLCIWNKWPQCSLVFLMQCSYTDCLKKISCSICSRNLFPHADLSLEVTS